MLLGLITIRIFRKHEYPNSVIDNFAVDYEDLRLSFHAGSPLPRYTAFPFVAQGLGFHERISYKQRSKITL